MITENQKVSSLVHLLLFQTEKQIDLRPQKFNGFGFFLESISLKVNGTRRSVLKVELIERFHDELWQWRASDIELQVLAELLFLDLETYDCLTNYLLQSPSFCFEIASVVHKFTVVGRPSNPFVDGSSFSFAIFSIESTKLKAEDSTVSLSSPRVLLWVSFYILTRKRIQVGPSWVLW